MNHQRAPVLTEPADLQPALQGAGTSLSGDSFRFYPLIIVVVMLGAYLYMMRSESIFSCPATGYSADNYLAYCRATHYGDYDHGAIWFDLEPGIRDSARDAEVVFLGSSRMQFGFSSTATHDWFSSNGIKYYLLGFAYWENYKFEKPLLDRLQPKAKAYVINLDTFFEETVSPPAQIVMHEKDADERYRRKQDWQTAHAKICAKLPVLCGNDQTFFRSRSTGSYELVGGRVVNIPTTYEETVDPAIVRDYTARAGKFIAGLHVDNNCVLLTMVPTVKTNIATARAIASALGTELIAPDVAGLNTFDESHMDRASAERWSKSFFDAAGARIRQCAAQT